MALRNAAGTVLTRAQALALTTPVVADPEITFTADVYEDTEFEGGGQKTGEQLKWRDGETIKQSEFDRVYPLPTVAAIAPAGGGIAGGTAVTITGTGFEAGEQVIGGGGQTPGAAHGVTVTVGGVACTNVAVQDDGKLTCTTGAHAAGAADVIVTTQAGPSAALAGGFAYA